VIGIVILSSPDEPSTEMGFPQRDLALELAALPVAAADFVPHPGLGTGCQDAKQYNGAECARQKENVKHDTLLALALHTRIISHRPWRFKYSGSARRARKNVTTQATEIHRGGIEIHRDETKFFCW
jgi:hypothetical protein